MRRAFEKRWDPRAAAVLGASIGSIPFVPGCDKEPGLAEAWSVSGDDKTDVSAGG